MRRSAKSNLDSTNFAKASSVFEMKKEGFRHFSMHHHTELWKAEDAKAQGKGYGVQVAKTWYWYERWLAFVREHCQKNQALYVRGETTSADH